MKIGDLRRFTDNPISDTLGVTNKLFFINNILEDGGVYEIIMLHSGQKCWYTLEELCYYSKIIKEDKKCP